MKTGWFTVFLLLPPVVANAQPGAPPCNCSEGVHFMPADEVAKALNDAKVPVSAMTVPPLRPNPNFQEQLIVRNASGQVETHTNWIDHIVILDGEGTMTVGGTVANNKETAAGEWRGDSSKGGVPQRLAPHATLDIPAGMPHWLTLPPGGHIAYVVFKEKN